MAEKCAISKYIKFLHRSYCHYMLKLLERFVQKTYQNTIASILTKAAHMYSRYTYYSFLDISYFIT